MADKKRPQKSRKYARILGKGRLKTAKRIKARTRWTTSRIIRWLFDRGAVHLREESIGNQVLVLTEATIHSVQGGLLDANLVSEKLDFKARYAPGTKTLLLIVEPDKKGKKPPTIKKFDKKYAGKRKAFSIAPPNKPT